MSQCEDKSLREFLKANQPIAPEPRPGEFASLVQRLDLPSPQVNGVAPAGRKLIRASLWFGVGGALAAGLMGIWMTLSHPTHLTTGGDQALQDSEWAVFDDLSDEEELPTVDVGEEFIGLMASRGE